MATFDKMQACFVQGPYPSALQCSPFPPQEASHQQQQPPPFAMPSVVPSVEFTYNSLPQHHQQHHGQFQASSEYIKQEVHEATISSISAATEEAMLPNHNSQPLGPYLESSSNLYNEQQQLLQQQMRREHLLFSEQQHHQQQSGEQIHGGIQELPPQCAGPLPSSASASPETRHSSSSSSPNSISIASITPLASPTLSACLSSLPAQTMVPDLFPQSAPLPMQTLMPSQSVVTSMEMTVAPGSSASPSSNNNNNDAFSVGSMQQQHPNHIMSFNNSLNPEVPVAWMNNMLAPSKMARLEHHNQHHQHQQQQSPLSPPHPQTRFSSAYRVNHGNHFLAATAPGRMAPTRSMSLSYYAGDVLSEQMLAQQQQQFHQQQQHLQRRSMSISVYPSMTFTHSSTAAAHGPAMNTSPSPVSGTPFSSMASSPALSPMPMTDSPIPPMCNTNNEWELHQHASPSQLMYHQQQPSHDGAFQGFGSPTSPSAGIHQMSLEPKYITPHPFASYTFPPVQEQQDSSPLPQQQQRSAPKTPQRPRKPARAATGAPTKAHHQRQPTPLTLTSRLPSPLSSQPSSPITTATGLANVSCHRKSSLSTSSSSSSSSSPSLTSELTTPPTSVLSTPSSTLPSCLPSSVSSPSEVHACAECDMTFAGPAVLLRHQESIHKKIAWCCMGCGSRLCRRDAVTRHMNLSPTGSICRQVGEIGQLNKVGDEYVVVERNPYVAKPLRVVLTKMGKRLPPGLEEEEDAAAAVSVTVPSGAADPMAISPSMMMATAMSESKGAAGHPTAISMTTHSRKRSSPGDEHTLSMYSNSGLALESCSSSPYLISGLKSDRKQRRQKSN